MNNSIEHLQINSFNTRDIRNSFKRKNIFNWLKTSHHGICMFQETHTISTDREKWKREWDGPIFFSDGESNCRGVATLIPHKLTNSFEIIETKNRQQWEVPVDTL